MCGINVLLGPSQDPVWIEGMNDAIQHRGPDDAGHYYDANHVVALGSRRLKIIDTNTGHMPYRSPCGRYAMVFNGEVYNFAELREQVQDYTFQSQTDGEVLFALLQQKGCSVLAVVNGMFTFALWDEKKRTCTVGRDRLGIKPLFYAEMEHGLAFSSEIKGLLSLPQLSLSWNREATSHYFSTLCFPEPESVYQGIKRFPAAHVVELHVSPSGEIKPSTDIKPLNKKKPSTNLKPSGEGKPNALGEDVSLNTDTPHSDVSQLDVLPLNKVPFHRYWSLSHKKNHQEDHRETLQHQFRAAVRRRLVSDVPLGVFLSSGVDSTLVAKCSVEELGRPVVCHTMSFEGESGEGALAEQTAEQLNCPIQHHTLTADVFLASIPSILQHFEEPFSGGVPLWFLCEAASKDLTVALTGTGGDECFGNYGRGWSLQPKLGAWRAIKSFLKGDSAWKRGAEATRYALQHGASWGTFYHEKNAVMKTLQKSTWLKGHWGCPTEERMDEVFWRRQEKMDLDDRLMHFDIKTQLKDEFLYSQDILSMAHSMELRVPFCDHTFVEACAQVSSILRHHVDHPKGWMLDVFKAWIPDHILNRPKTGFRIPYGLWLRGPLQTKMEELIAEDRLQAQQCFHARAIREAWGRHLKGDSGYEYPLWSMFIFQMWLDQQQEAGRMMMSRVY